MKHYNKNYKKVDSFWLAIRCSTPNNDFDIPRWHHDGKFFKTKENERAHKFVTTLQSNSTLYLSDKKLIKKFIEKNEKLHKKMFKKEIKDFKEQINYEYKHIRPKLAKIVGKKYNKVPDNKGLIFEVGPKNAVIHSEPPIEHERIFISILPGTYSQISELKQKRNR